MIFWQGEDPDSTKAFGRDVSIGYKRYELYTAGGPDTWII